MIIVLVLLIIIMLALSSSNSLVDKPPKTAEEFINDATNLEIFPVEKE